MRSESIILVWVERSTTYKVSMAAPSCVLIRESAINAKNNVVAPEDNIRAQDSDRDARERSGNFGQELFVVPRPKSNEAVAVACESFPFAIRHQWLLASA